MKFCWTTIYVKNMEESLKFYQEIVGLEIDRQLSVGPMELAFLGKGETKVELIYNGKKDIDLGKDISLGFEVKSAEEKMQFLKSRNYEVQGPFSPNPSIVFFYTTDPNGLKIQFVENKM